MAHITLSSEICEIANGAPVLFLDVDGSLGPSGQAVYMAEFQPWAETCASLELLIRETNTIVVPCTSRIGQQPDLLEHIQKLVCPKSPWQVAGHCGSPRFSGFNGKTPKEAMIIAWLEEADRKGITPRTWAVFDDDGHPRGGHWTVAGRWVVPKGPLLIESPEWWMLWNLLSGFSVS